MKNLSTALLLVLAFAGSTLGQSLNDTVIKVRQIKLLQSTRSDVKRILRGYDATDNSEHSQTFSNEDLSIEVTYSGGDCSDDPDEEDASDIWNVREWTVTRIEIEPSEPVTLRDSGLNLSTFKKNPRYPDDSSSLVLHDKSVGIAVKTSEDGIETIIFFPQRANSYRLCRISSAARGFYKRKGWFTQAHPYDYISDESGPANVTELNLSAVEIDVSSTTRVSVNTIAIDPENDVLTYNYTVSAGKIEGTGARVIWDLTGVSPGSYTITAGVDDGCGVCGKTVTKTVVVK
jgi:hypothetical protein